MSIHSKLEKQIDKKREEIELLRKEVAEIDLKIKTAEAYIEATEEALKLIPKEEKKFDPNPPVRPGSDVAKTRDYLRGVGEPQRIEQILEAIGYEVTAKNRQSVAGSLSHNFRQGKIFTRPEPNTFGLLEWELGKGKQKKSPPAATDSDPVSLPETFGRVMDDNDL